MYRRRSHGWCPLRGALSQGILRRDDVSIVVRRPEHRDELVDELGVTGFVELPDMAQFDTIILAVKPQVLPSVLSQLTSVKAGATVISVEAGVTLDTFAQSIANSDIIPCHAEYPLPFWRQTGPERAEP